MLDTKSNDELIDHVTSNLIATPDELLLAERLHAALEELDAVQARLKAAEGTNGADA